MGCLSGPVYDAGYINALLRTGCVILVTGQVLLSFSTQYWHVLLSQGVVMGLGAGCLFVPSLSILSTYFNDTRISLVMGVASAGGSLGGILFPIIFHQNRLRIGFHWAMRVGALVMLVTLAVPLVVLRARTLPPKIRKLVDVSAFRSPAYLIYIAGGLLVFMGLCKCQ